MGWWQDKRGTKSASDLVVLRLVIDLNIKHIRLRARHLQLLLPIYRPMTNTALASGWDNLQRHHDVIEFNTTLSCNEQSRPKWHKHNTPGLRGTWRVSRSCWVCQRQWSLREIASATDWVEVLRRTPTSRPCRAPHNRATCPGRLEHISDREKHVNNIIKYQLREAHATCSSIECKIQTSFLCGSRMCTWLPLRVSIIKCEIMEDVWWLHVLRVFE